MALSLRTILNVSDVFIYIRTCGDTLIPDCISLCIGNDHLNLTLLKVAYTITQSNLFRYIYLPMIGPNKGLKGSLLASTMCFSFVYLWHGLMPHVMLWSFLNYVGIVCETVSKAIWQTATYQRIEVWKI